MIWTLDALGRYEIYMKPECNHLFHLRVLALPVGCFPTEESHGSSPADVEGRYQKLLRK